VRFAAGTWEIRLAGAADPISAAGQRTLAAVRAVPAPVPVLTGGQAADFADQGGIEETDFVILAAIAFALSTASGPSSASRSNP
jgi:hypothetical protein